ncbi:MAG: hypothetical protein R3C18_19645 [Planctomycetaceae bacterium]
MRPQLRQSNEIAHLLDEVQSLLLQYDRNSYNVRQNVPHEPNGAPLYRVEGSSPRKDMNMDQQPTRDVDKKSPTSAAGDDYVPAGRLQGAARAERLAQIRAQIEDGTYDDEERFEKALDRLLERLNG